MQDFVHLHVHTQYSLLDGQASVARLVDKAMKNATYITSYNGARSLIMKVERDELVEELLKAYIEHNSWE